MQYYQECIALGSKSGLSLVSTAPSAEIEELYRELWRAIFLFERRFSRFLPDSELSIFNRNTGSKQAVSPEFHDILTAARDIADETNGLFNPFILPAIQAAGYSHSRVPGHEQDAVDNHANKAVVAPSRLEIGPDWARIPYGTALDFGGCGKGYLADQLRDLLPNSITGYWLSFGGDIAAGGHDAQDNLWAILIESADNPTENVGKFVPTHPSGIATSGTTVIRGKRSGKVWHHLIDPRTHRPAQTDVLLATVCDRSALRADALASCAVILGSKQGLKFLKDKGVTAAVLQHQTPAGESRVIHYGDDIIMQNAYA